MKCGRLFYGAGLVLVANYLLNQMWMPAIYFGFVLCALMVYYRQILIDRMLHQTVIRFACLLGCACLFEISVTFLQAMVWFVLCAVSSGLSQSVEKYSISALEVISIINICLVSAAFCLILMSSMTGWNISEYVMLMCALFQPSYLSLDLSVIHKAAIK